MTAPHIGPLWDLPIVAARWPTDSGWQRPLYWGEPGVVEHIATLACAGLAGDLCADGAIGSRTAALRAPYADRADHRGHAVPDRRADRRPRRRLHRAGRPGRLPRASATRRSTTIARGFELAAEKVGVQALVAARHRLEHVEMVDAGNDRDPRALRRRRQRPAGVRRAVGRPGRHVRRARSATGGRRMNPFGRMHRAGVALAFGSDTPVTPLDPLGGRPAAAFHHDEAGAAHRAGRVPGTHPWWLASGRRRRRRRARTRCGRRRTRSGSDADLVVQTPDQRVAAWSTDPRAGVPVLPDLSAGTPCPPVCGPLSAAASRTTPKDASQ